MEAHDNTGPERVDPNPTLSYGIYAIRQATIISKYCGS